MSDEKPKRQWYRFSSRSLLVFVTVVCVCFGWLGTVVRAKQQERAIVKAILESGGKVFYSHEIGPDGLDFHFRGGLYGMRRKAIPAGPEWLRHWLGDDCLENVTAIRLGPSRHTDFGLSQLRELSQLQTLVIEGQKYTNADLRDLEQLAQVRQMFFEYSGITPEGRVILRASRPDLTIKVRNGHL